MCNINCVVDDVDFPPKFLIPQIKFNSNVYNEEFIVDTKVNSNFPIKQIRIVYPVRCQYLNREYCREEIIFEIEPFYTIDIELKLTQRKRNRKTSLMEFKSISKSLHFEFYTGELYQKIKLRGYGELFKLFEGKILPELVRTLETMFKETFNITCLTESFEEIKYRFEERFTEMVKYHINVEVEKLKKKYIFKTIYLNKTN